MAPIKGSPKRGCVTPQKVKTPLVEGKRGNTLGGEKISQRGNFFRENYLGDTTPQRGEKFQTNPFLKTSSKGGRFYRAPF